MKKTVRLVAFIALCEAVGIVGSVFTISSINTWYATLVKPPFNPPDFVFAPVWTILYLLMGVSLFLVWGKKRVDLRWFWIQLGLNALWSITFFGLHSPRLAFGEIIILWVSIFLTIKTFYKVNRTAAYLLYPYLAWVGLASLLNLAIVLLN